MKNAQFKKGHIPWNKGNGRNINCLSCNKKFYVKNYELKTRGNKGKKSEKCENS